MAIIHNYFGCKHTCSTNKKDKYTREHIQVKDHQGTWYVVDQKYYRTKGWFFLLEHETYGDEAACVIISADYSLVLDDVWNGFDDLEDVWADEEFEKAQKDNFEVEKCTKHNDNLIELNIKWNKLRYSVIVRIDFGVPGYFYANNKPEDYLRLEQAIENYLGIKVALPF